MSRGELSETEWRKKTQFENAIPYFEKAVKAGPKYVTWVLGSRMYLVGLYMDELSKEIGAELPKESPLSTDALTGQTPPAQSGVPRSEYCVRLPKSHSVQLVCSLNNVPYAAPEGEMPRD